MWRQSVVAVASGSARAGKIREEAEEAAGMAPVQRATDEQRQRVAEVARSHHTEEGVDAGFAAIGAHHRKLDAMSPLAHLGHVENDRPTHHHPLPSPVGDPLCLHGLGP